MLIQLLRKLCTGCLRSFVLPKFHDGEINLCARCLKNAEIYEKLEESL